MKAVLAVLAASAILGGATVSLITPGSNDTSAGAVTGPYAGVGLDPPADTAPTARPPAVATLATTPLPPAPTLAATPSPVILGARSTPAPTPVILGGQSTPAPTPVILGGQSTPAPTSEPTAETMAQDRCPRLPVLISPSDELAAATVSAIAMWERHLGCDAFTIASGGIIVTYDPAWPGDCEDADIAACTYNGVFLSPLEPRYDPASVIAHELGHVLNFGHDDGPSVMSPVNWSGPSTVFCEVATRCR